MRVLYSFVPAIVFAVEKTACVSSKEKSIESEMKFPFVVKRIIGTKLYKTWMH